jgi:hypothetical protein
MALIQLTEAGELLNGKLSGGIIQTSQFGKQVRKWSEPRNPQTMLQQTRRNNFLFLQSRYRNLSAPEQSSWSLSDGSATSGIRRQCGNNVNRHSVNQSTLSTYTSDARPGTFGLQLLTFDASNVIIGDATVTLTVPVDTKLFLQITAPRTPAQRFVSPGEFVSFLQFDEGFTFLPTSNFIVEYNRLFAITYAPAIAGIRMQLVNKINGRSGLPVVFVKE